MAANPLPLPISSSLQQNVSSLHGAAVQSGGGATNVFTEEGKIRELALQLHGSLVQAQQLKLASTQQPTVTTNQQVRYILSPCRGLIAVSSVVNFNHADSRGSQTTQRDNIVLARSSTRYIPVAFSTSAVNL